MDKANANQYSPLALAFFGDAVYSQLVREKLVLASNMPVRKLHGAAVERVRAEYQSRAVEFITPMLDENELAILKRGRNAHTSSGATPKNSNPREYHNATSLEALFGWLELIGNEERKRELFNSIWENVEVIGRKTIHDHPHP